MFRSLNDWVIASRTSGRGKQRPDHGGVMIRVVMGGDRVTRTGGSPGSPWAMTRVTHHPFRVGAYGMRPGPLPHRGAEPDVRPVAPAVPAVAEP